MVLPPIEKTPVLLMRFTPKASKIMIEGVIAALTQGGIIIVESEGSSSQSPNSSGTSSKNAFILGLTTTQKLLEHEAEIIRLVKPRRTVHKHIPTVMDRFTTNARDNFTSLGNNDTYGDYDSFGLFTSAERALLVESMINAIPCEDPKLFGIGGEKKHHVRSSFIGDAYNKITNSSVGNAYRKSYRKFKQSISSSQDDYEEATATLIQVLKQKECIDIFSPLHIPHIAKKILKDTYTLTKSSPLKAMRDYYGEEVAYYWAWMDFMTRWYTFPGLLGLVCWVMRNYRGDTVDTCDLTPFVGLFVFCWAVICMRYWERREIELACKWGTFMFDWIPVQRPGFRGRLRRSPISGKMERYYPPTKRIVKLIASGLITGFLFIGICCIMVISMNLQGYVSRLDRELWGRDNHPLYYPFFAQFAEESAIFDVTSWRGMIPVILRSVIVMNINFLYSKLVMKLAEWENHETTRSHRNSIVLRRFFFEAFDAYIVLFYLACYERRIDLLRLELVGAFSVDTFRRVFTECVLPFAIRYFTSPKVKDSVGISKKNDDMAKAPDNVLSVYAELEDYDTFDDYIEMIIQFGYVTLFASAFPLAAFLAIFSNLIEMRTDAWKKVHLLRRMSPCRENGIGMWRHVLKGMSWLSIMSNLYLFAFTSSQLRQWFPEYYHTDPRDGNTVANPSKFSEILLTVLIIEHCIIVIAVLLRSAIPSLPHSTHVELQKSTWYHENKAEQSRATSRRQSLAVCDRAN